MCGPFARWWMVTFVLTVYACACALSMCKPPAVFPLTIATLPDNLGMLPPGGSGSSMLATWYVPMALGHPVLMRLEEASSPSF